MVQCPDTVRRAPHVDLTNHLVTRQVDDAELLRPTRGHIQSLAVSRNVHAIRSAGHWIFVGHLERFDVDAADGVGDTVADENTAAVAGCAEGMCALAGRNLADQPGLGARHVEYLNAIAARQPHQQRLAAMDAEDIGRHRAGRGAPSNGLRRQVDGDHFVAVLHRHVGNGAGAVDPDMARRLAGRNALGELQILAVPTVDVDMVQTIAGGDEPLHVTRELQLVRVDDPVDHALHLGRARVQERQRIARRVRDDDRLFVRRHVDMVRLLAGRDALLFAPVVGTDDADAGIERVQNKDRRKLGGGDRLKEGCHDDGTQQQKGREAAGRQGKRAQKNRSG